MTRPAAEIEAAVRHQGLLAPGRGVLVLFSGGRDSTCLLDLAVRIAGSGVVHALHVNYGLRPGAVMDERHCAEVCAQLGVPLAIRRPPGPPSRTNLQAWARSRRYALARELAGDDDHAAGHTATDQVETVLYRLISSPSRRALLGMEPRTGRLIRPLLSLEREETGAYCRERGVPFRDDPTNQGGDYVRNRLRNEVIPLLRQLHPGAEANILALAEVLRAEHELLAEQVRDTLDGRSELTLAELTGLAPGLARLVIQQLADGAIGAPAAGVARRTADILAMGDDAMLDLPAGVRAITRGGELSFGRTPTLDR